MAVVQNMQNDMIDLREVKKLVFKLPKNEAMRELILGEPDFISRLEFEIKSEVWRRLL